jgi:hypothetical protein
LPKERRDEIKKQFVQISVRTAKRQRPMITVSCERPEDFHHVSDLLCSAAGIEMYLGRRTSLGELAQEVQDNFFAQRLQAARMTMPDQWQSRSPVTEEQPVQGDQVAVATHRQGWEHTEVLDEEGDAGVCAQRIRFSA